MFPTPGTIIMEGFAVNMAMFVDHLSEEFGRAVVDKTGFSGVFNFELTYFSEEYAAPVAIPGAISNAPPISKALQEQLGLKLTSSRDKAEVLIIDDVRRPTPNCWLP